MSCEISFALAPTELQPDLSWYQMFQSLYSGPHQCYTCFFFQISSPAFYSRHFCLAVFILMQLYCLKSGCYSVGARAKEISNGYTQPHRTLQIKMSGKIVRKDACLGKQNTTG